MAKVLLVQPHDSIKDKENKTTTYTPLSLIYLGTAIEDKHKIKIYDRNLNANDKDFLNFLKKYNPDIIGFTSITSSMLFDIINLGKLIKKESPEITIIVGGVHATVEPDSLLNEPYVDYIMRGEGEEAFLEFCDVFDKNPKKLGKLKNINHNPLRPFVDMNKLKLPNYDLIDVEKYEHFYINFSRGCPGNCTFCFNAKMWGINGRPFVRAYSAEKIIELFRNMIEKYKIKVFSITDDNFLFFKKRVMEVCNFLKNYNVYFFVFGRVDYIDDEVLKALKKAGCHTIQMGIESGSQRILDYLNKKTTVEQNINAVKLCGKYGITSDASMMIGLPTETIKELNETVNFVKKYKPDVPNIKIFNPLPGSALFEEYIAKGAIKKPKTLEEWAIWTGDLRGLKHNLSEISDEYLEKTISILWGSRFFITKFKKFLFWIKAREFRYVLKGIKRAIIIKLHSNRPIFTGKD